VYAGLGIVVAGAVILLASLVLRLAHRHALHHMCPDPSVHPRPMTFSAEEIESLLAERRESGEVERPAG
jgi:hypothetical protein